MKVLFIGYQDIFGKVNAGGVQVSRRNYDLVSAVGETYAALLCFDDHAQTEGDHVRYFRKLKDNLSVLKAALCLRKWYTGAEEKKIIAYIKEVKPDVVFLDGSVLGRLLKYIPSDIKSVVYFHNVEADYAWNKVKEEGWWFLPSYWTSRYNEKISIKKAMAIACLNQRDGERLAQLYGRSSDYYLPVTFQDRFDEQKLQRNSLQKELLFIGSMFPPNYHGILWFVNEIMCELPEFHLTIVGKDFETKKEELERGNVTVVGTVDDLEEYYYTYSTIVMPIQYGAGMKVKTAEAMMYGVSIFATDEALEGYQVQDVEGIYRCNTVQEFIEAIKGAYASNVIHGFEPAVRDVYLKNHETDRQIERFKNILEKVVD